MELNLAEMGPADLDLAIRGKLLRERDLKSDDPRKKAIDTALRNDPNSVPVWLELGIDPTLKATLDPSLTLPGGALLKLGITAEAGAKISSQRLLTPTRGDDWKSAVKRDAKRLTGHPFSASALARALNKVEISRFLETGNSKSNHRLGSESRHRVPSMPSRLQHLFQQASSPHSRAASQ